jgi:RNA polymerase sigma factor (sigma-70 family)
LSATRLVEHFFRHEYGRLVALLSRRVGFEHLALIEDSVQFALLAALESWTARGLPDNPSAWVYKVACHNILGELRQRQSHAHLLSRNRESLPDLTVDPEYFLSREIQDDLLLMLYSCCHPAIPIESQLALALKTLCGFDVREIALRLFSTQASIYKRLKRARDQLQRQPDPFDPLNAKEYAQRLSAVHHILYLLFTEGYLSSHLQLAIRRELCEEAKRLTRLLIDNPQTSTPQGFALLALMHLHSARLITRVDSDGSLLLLEQQDRSLWDREEIYRGLSCLEKSAEGCELSRYHAEAGIAAEHCLAPSFKQTRWQKIAEYYQMLESIAPSPLHSLNRAVVIAEWQGPAAALRWLESLPASPGLQGSHYRPAVLADLNYRSGHRQQAFAFRQQALALAPTPKIKQLLATRLNFA